MHADYVENLYKVKGNGTANEIYDANFLTFVIINPSYFCYRNRVMTQVTHFGEYLECVIIIHERIFHRP